MGMWHDLQTTVGNIVSPDGVDGWENEAEVTWTRDWQMNWRELRDI